MVQIILARTLHPILCQFFLPLMAKTRILLLCQYLKMMIAEFLLKNTNINNILNSTKNLCLLYVLNCTCYLYNMNTFAMVTWDFLALGPGSKLLIFDFLSTQTLKVNESHCLNLVFNHLQSYRS